jgi:hypothetical protein
VQVVRERDDRHAIEVGQAHVAERGRHAQQLPSAYLPISDKTGRPGSAISATVSVCLALPRTLHIGWWFVALRVNS